MILFYKPKILPIRLFCMTNNAEGKRYLEEQLRLLNEILAVLKENNRIMNEHNSVVNSIDERVRRIGLNTSNMR